MDFIVNSNFLGDVDFDPSTFAAILLFHAVQVAWPCIHSSSPAVPSRSAHVASVPEVLPEHQRSIACSYG